MASLKKRGSTYSLTFTQRDDDGLVQKTYWLGVSRKDQADGVDPRAIASLWAA